MNGERGLQQAVFEYLRLALPDGAVVAVCRSLDQVHDFLATLMPLRARVAA